MDMITGQRANVELRKEGRTCFGSLLMPARREGAGLTGEPHLLRGRDLQQPKAGMGPESLDLGRIAN